MEQIEKKVKEKKNRIKENKKNEERENGKEGKDKENTSKERDKDTHEWYCCWMKLNSSLILSQVSATVNFSPPAAPPLPPPPCKKKGRENERIRLAMYTHTTMETRQRIYMLAHT